MLVKLEPTDTRPSEILRLVGSGLTAKDAAAKVGICRKTVTRWRQGLAGFSAAVDRAAALSSGTSPAERAALDELVRMWTPGGLVELAPEPVAPRLEAPAARPAPAPAAVATTTAAGDPELVIHKTQAREPAERPECVEPDVLDARGTELTKLKRRPPGPDAEPEPAPYTTVRPPTSAEWLSAMAALSLDKRQPPRVRAVAIAAVSSVLHGGPMRGRAPAEAEQVASTVRGREPGVPASVWKEARENFLGPDPGAAEDDRIGDVVEFGEAAKS